MTEQDKKEEHADLEDIIRKMGYEAVEINTGRQNQSVRVRIVVYRKEAFGIDECGDLHQVLFPRCRQIFGTNDVALEVSTPGLTRTLKKPDEYRIFAGREIRILTRESSEWRRGVLAEPDPDKQEIYLQTEGETQTIPLHSIIKAKLDYSGRRP